MANPTSPPSYEDAIDSTKGVSVGFTSHMSHQNESVQLDSNISPRPEHHPPGYPDIEHTTFAPTGAAQSSPDNIESTEIEAGFTVRGTFGDMAVRRLFIRKVFLTLGLQLLITFGFVCIFFFVKDVKHFVQTTSAVYYVAYAVFFSMYFVLVCFVNVARKHPTNIIMLMLLTLALSYMVGTIASFYDLESVMVGLGVTVVVCFSVIVFSIQTKYDFTKCGGMIFVLLFVLVMFGFVTIFTYYRDWYVQVVYGCLGALVFTLFLAFDTQLVMGGRKYELDPEEYIFGSLVLYIDIIYIFLFLLSIFGGSSK